MKLFALIPLIVALAAAFLFGCAWLLMKLWGVALVPFGVPAITYWQAFGIWCLLSIVASMLRSRK